MTRRSRIVTLLVLAAILAVAAPSRAAESGAQIVDGRWIAAVKAGDLAAVMKCYAADAVLWLPNAPAARGTKE